MASIQEKALEKAKSVIPSQQKLVKAGDADTYLLKDIERFYKKYVKEKSKRNIISRRSARRFGVDRIGEVGDVSEVLGFGPNQLFYGASQRAKNQAANEIFAMAIRDNFTQTFITKRGTTLKNIVKVSSNIYLRVISPKGRASYIQARNINTGRIVSKHTVESLLGKL